MEQLEHQNEQPQDHLCYLTRTPGGKILKSSSLYIRNSRGAVTAIFSINYDITNIMMMHQELGEFMLTRDREQSEPEKIINVNDVLDELIQQSVALVGKPAALMNKDDKIRAIRFSATRARSWSPSPATKWQNTSVFPNTPYIPISMRTNNRRKRNMGKIDLSINKVGLAA